MQKLSMNTLERAAAEGITSDRSGIPVPVLSHLDSIRAVSLLLEEPDRLNLPSAWTEHIPFAYWLIDAHRPRQFVELGTHYGISYFAFCQAVSKLGLPTRCYAIDNWHGDEHTGSYDESVFTSVSEYNAAKYGGFSELLRSTFEEALPYFLDGSIDLLHIDGLHTYEAVKNDFESWLPKLSDCAVVLFHDTNVRERDFGVFRLWDELKERYPNFEFLHGHGLGVLGVGKDIAPPLQSLFATARDPAATSAVRKAFWRAAGSLRRTQALEASRDEIARLVAATAAKEDEIARLVAAASERNAELARLTAALTEKDAEQARLITVINEKDTGLIAQKQEIARVIAAHEEKSAQIDALLTGRSWRCTALVRRFALSKRRLGLFSRSILSLQPLNHLELVATSGSARTWNITGNDPHFALTWHPSQPLPPGHYLVELEFFGESAQLFDAHLYVDSGSGFIESYRVPLRFESLRKNVVRTSFILPEGAQALRFDPSTQPGHLQLGSAYIQKAPRTLHYARLAVREARRRAKNPRAVASAAKRVVRSLAKDGLPGVAAMLRQSGGLRQSSAHEYPRWIALYDTISEDDRRAMRDRVASWPSRPLVSVVIPTYNTPENLLREAIDSVFDQTYDNWELCIADDASTNPDVRKVLEEYRQRDSRVKVVYRSENGHISRASNSAVELATGDWIALLDHDDLLAPHALFCIADAIVRNPEAQIIYSDEDKIDGEGRRFDPYFKCDWNPVLFRSHNLISHLGAYRADTLRQIGGFRTRFDGSQDYDLALRFVERARSDQIIHLPHVLYHWRVLPGSTAFDTAEKPYATVAGERALNEHLARTGIRAKTQFHGVGYRTDFEPPSPAPLVSIIIPTRNGLLLTRQCIDSIVRRTTYAPYEILLVDNGSDDPDALAYFQHLASEGVVRLLRDDRPFNYSALNNAAIRHAAGSVVCLLNNDIEVITPDWLTRMVSIALQPETGAVGAKLLYPDDTLQHGGVIIGLGGVAGHAHLKLPRNAFGYFARAALDQNMSAVTAACLVVRKDLYNAVGGLDEHNLAVAFNDVDFCLKLLKIGRRNVWTPFAELYHHESASRGSDATPEKQARFKGEVEYSARTWAAIIEHDPAYSPNLTLDRADFSLAFPPRVGKPWHRQGDLQSASRDAARRK